MDVIKVKPRGLFQGLRSKGPVCSILYFGESPGAEEAVSKTAFTGPSGRHLQEVIENLMPGVPCILDNVCPEYLNGAKPLKKELDRYADYREKAIQRFQPKVIVALGAIATKGLGIDASPIKNCGAIYEVAGIPCVISIHPAYILRDPTQIGLWERVFAGIRSCLKSSPQSPGKGTEGDTGIRRVDDVTSLRQWLKHRESRLCSFDLETSSLDPSEGRVLCCAICDGKETIWVPWTGDWNRSRKVEGEILDWWHRGPRIVHNSKFEFKWMRHLGEREPKVFYDTMLQAWLLNENEPKGLDHLVTSELGHPPYWLDVDLKNPAEVPLDKLGLYNALDAKYTFELHLQQREKLGKVRCRLLDGVVSPLAATLVRMEERGVHVSPERLAAITKQMKALATRRLKETEKQFPGVNIGSPQQLRRLIFKPLVARKVVEGVEPPLCLNLTPTSRTDKGKASTKAEVLEKLAKKEPRLATLAEARKVQSLINRVLLPWHDALDDDGLIHSTFGLGNVVTGRLSSSNPNLQNIDRASKIVGWKGIQKTAVTSRHKNGQIVQLDLMQGELRVQAAVAGDEKFLEAFRNGEDPHQMTADELHCDRSKAKNINFSIIYLISAYGLEERYGIPRKEGAKLIARWYDLHPRIREYQTQCFESVERYGYVESVFGWRRHLADMHDEHQRSQAVNFPIQNACVVITYLGMLAVEKMLPKGSSEGVPSDASSRRTPRKLEEEGYKSRIVLQIHDSIVLDCPRREAKVVAKKAKALMEGLDLKPWVGNRLKHSIPIGVDIKIGEHL